MPDDTATASPGPGKLPPMTALEFAIASTFRHFFFGIRLALAWAVLMLPLTAVAYVVALRDGPPDISAPSPEAIAVAAVLGLVQLLASFSIAVNWHRRLVLGETPQRLAWVRLDGVVWRYLVGVLFVVTAIALLAAAAAAAAMFLPSQLAIGFSGLASLFPFSVELNIGGGFGYLIAALIGFSAFFTLCRLMSWLPAIAVRDKDYTVRQAWKATRNNRLAYLSFTFWLLFTLAIAGALGAGAVFAQQAINDIYVTAAAFAFATVLGWLTMFLTLSIATSHYCHFAGKLNSTGCSQKP